MLRSSFAPGTVKRIYERDEGMCVYCGASAQQVDHVVPVSKGGPSIVANGVCVCRSCNGKKGGRLALDMITRGLFWLSTHGENTDWVDSMYRQALQSDVVSIDVPIIVRRKETPIVALRTKPEDAAPPPVITPTALRRQMLIEKTDKPIKQKEGVNAVIVRRSKGNKERVERNASILVDYEAGVSARRLARRWRIAIARIYQIISMAELAREGRKRPPGRPRRDSYEAATWQASQ